MIKRVDVLPRHDHVFGNPAPLGLMGLAIACFALAPLSFGLNPEPVHLRTMALYALLFGGFCQLLTGLMDFANKNAFGGAIFTLFSFGWMKNALALFLQTQGVKLSHDVDAVIDVVQLVLLVVLTYGFGFFSKILFIFLLDIDLLYLAKVINFATDSQVMAVPIGVLTVLLGLLSLWIALASLINPVAGRAIFPETGPLFRAQKKSIFDFSLRFAIFKILYDHWRSRAYDLLPLQELQKQVEAVVGEQSIVPDLFYLREYGCLVLTFRDSGETTITGVRLNSNGIDLYEQLALKKYEF